MIRLRPVWHLLSALCIALALTSGCVAEEAWPTYRGAWFEVDYPPGFAVSPSIESPSLPGEHDSAFFAAPDGSVSFYVYSPQWGGEPIDIRLDDGVERLASESESKQGEVTVRWYTIRAEDGSYAESYQDRQDALSGTRTVLGVRYRDDEAREHHRAEYLRFKTSLKQFAD